ncbi:hypothetical protein NA78x_002090 [Anatilimnocola sp. NA78]|uniref:hypothetical protein n=1 Tax=Anatilimnocola sp. NA78 TaxID=3415683 RepID=UPI003CE5BA28
MKKTQRVKPARRLFLESLERREVLAGNITVTLAQGLLTVVGDSDANQIGIYQQANGRFNVVALDGEEITGPTEDLIVRNIAVGMWAGDDFVQISAQPEEGEMLPVAAEVLGSVKVRGGDGDDILRVSVVGRQVGTFVLPSLSVGIEGDLVPPTNVGEVIVEQDDEVGVFSTITGSLTINTQGGDDMIDLINVSALNLNVNATSTANTGTTDNDTVTLSVVNALNATVNLGTSSVVEGVGGNSLFVDNAIFGTATLNGGNGPDLVAVSETRAALSLTINTFNAADVVDLDDVQVGLTQADYAAIADLIIEAFSLNLSALPFNVLSLIQYIPELPGYLYVYTGNGADEVFTNDLFSTSMIFISLDAGDDRLTATGYLEADVSILSGGLDFDRRFITADTSGVLSVILFEGLLPDPELAA